MAALKDIKDTNNTVANMQWPCSVVIVESPSANLNSIYIALKRIQNLSQTHSEQPSFTLKLSRNPEEILAAERVIFPGVGNANYIIKELEQTGLAKTLQQVQSPILGICLGMQLLFEQLSEGQQQPGLGLLPGCIQPLRPALHNKLSVPHMGWNTIEAQQQANYQILKPAYAATRQWQAYFVHSYYLPLSSITVASCHYGKVPISAIVRGQGVAKHIWGCQFHPEKSGSVGATLLHNWLLYANQTT